MSLRRKIIFYAILIVAIACRIILFVSHPGGLNQDEASIGYEAWSLLTSGMDRNGMSWPVHFIAWGSGQNALYAYLSLPFIKVFGLHVFSIRLVNLLCGILSIVAVYSMVNKAYGYKTAVIAMTLAAIAPWHIMLSRWALESNLFPAMFLFALWALMKAQEKRYFYYIAALLLGLSLYVYGSAYLVITLFAVVVMCYFLRQKAISWKEALFSVLLYLVIAFPIYLFVLINVLGWDTIRLGCFTIPRVCGERMLSMWQGLSISKILENIKMLVLFQTDGNIRNAIPYYGCFYLVSLPFCMNGILVLVKKREALSFMVLCALVCASGLFLVYSDPNINRVNAIYFPLIICTAAGLADMLKGKKVMLAVAGCYFLLFAGFCSQYFGKEYRDQIAEEFFASFGEALVQADELAKTDQGKRTVYVTGNVNMPYIYALFYNRIDPEVYLQTAEFWERNTAFEFVRSFAGYQFYVDDIDRSQPGIYVLRNDQLVNLEVTDEVYYFDRFSVVEIR